MGAMQQVVWWAAVVGLLSPSGATDDVTFDDVVLQSVNIADISANDAAQLVDPKKTGNLLFDANAVDSDTRLTLNFDLKSFKSTSSPYFRANPVFMSCLQKAFRYVLQTSENVLRLRSGFKTKADAPNDNDIQEAYARSGSGAILEFDDSSQGDVVDIANAVMLNCPFIFSLQQRDIGLVIMDDSVHVHMAGDDDTQPYFASNGYSGMNSAQFRTWCLDKIDLSIDPPSSPKCDIDIYLPVPANAVFPAGADSAAAVVGSLDAKVVRGSEDFRRLVQFAGTNVVFEDNEHNSAWCGTSGNPCVDCRAGIKGHAVANSCADRLMSPRLYNAVAILQKLVRDPLLLQGAATLKISESWDEPHAGAPAGDQPADSLHWEGRAAILSLQTNDVIDHTDTLARLAVCAQFDYVHNTGSVVLVAVKKQASVSPEVETFGDVDFLHVTPPSDQLSEHQLNRDELVDGEVEDFPLFDGSYKDSVKLGEHSTVASFKSASRYFRISKALVDCYDAIIDYEQKWSTTAVSLTVVRAYMTASEQAAVLDPDSDPRGDSHRRGEGLHLRYSSPLDPAAYTPQRLASAAVDHCSAPAAAAGRRLAVGVYADGVFVGLRSTFLAWVDRPELLPAGTGAAVAATYDAQMRRRSQQAIDGFVVNPSDPQAACGAVPEARQSAAFRHVHPSHVVAGRRRRAAGKDDDDDCVPRSDTPFCEATRDQRDAQFHYVWDDMELLPFEHDKEKVKNELRACLMACGTCRKGSVYEDKIEYCNNFLHWAPAGFMNAAANSTNLVDFSNLAVKDSACRGQQDCLDKAPLFAQMAPAIWKLHRPDITKSIEYELYGVNDNPLPVMELLQRLYAMHAKGKVTAWVENASDAVHIRNALEVVMLHNTEVSYVEMFVRDEQQVALVEQVVGAMIGDWAGSGCPRYTRPVIASIVVSPFPAGIAKRSVGAYSLNKDMFRKRKNYEMVWLQQLMAD